MIKTLKILTKREVYEMRACCSYVSQALKQARLDAGLMQEDIFSKWRLDGWNVISRKRCLEDMLIEITELGRGYVKKGKKAEFLYL